MDLLSRLEQASFPDDHALSLYLAAGRALDRRYCHALLISSAELTERVRAAS